MVVAMGCLMGPVETEVFIYVRRDIWKNVTHYHSARWREHPIDLAQMWPPEPRDEERDKEETSIKILTQARRVRRQHFS